MVSVFFQALSETHKHVTDRVNSAMRFYANLPDLHEHSLPEGDGAITILEDGTSKSVEMREMSASASRTIAPFEFMEPAEIYKMLDELGSKMAEQQHKLFTDKVGGAAQQAVNTFTHNGKLTPEDIFQIYSKIELGFFSDGTPHELEMVSNPVMVEEYNRVFAKIKNDKVLNKRYEEIIADKRHKWNARENLRKLAG